MSSKIVFCTDDTILAIGGALATVASKENVEIIRKIGSYEGQIQLNQNGIVLHEELKTLLSADELKAVILHEKGHLAHKRLVKMAAIGATGIFDNNDFEKEADAYAAKRVGPRATISALVKLIANAIKDAPAELKTEVWKGLHASGRIQTLLAMR